MKFLFLITVYGMTGPQVEVTDYGLTGEDCVARIEAQVAADPDFAKGIPSCEPETSPLD